MIVLYIIASLLALVLLILFLDIRLVFEINDQTRVRLKILFLSFDVEKLVVRLAEKKEPIEKPEQTKKKSPQSFDTILLKIKYLTRLVRAVVHEFCQYARLKICYVYIKVATDDAAETAKAYGTVSAVVYSLVEFLSYNLKTDKNYKKIHIFPDFASNEFRAKMKIVLKIKPIHILFAVAHLLPLVQKRKVGTK